MRDFYDVIVIGGGHAGVEAALSAYRIGASVCIITPEINDIGTMSCNPAMGGIGKGHIIREIDALDGAIGRISDMAGIHYRLLNHTKGPAVYGIRAQIDRDIYRSEMLAYMQGFDIDIILDKMLGIHIIDNIYRGIYTEKNGLISSKSVVISTGTFMGARIQYGSIIKHVGRMYGPNITTKAEEDLRNHGIKIGKMKTGSPPRLDGRTIDWNIATKQPGDTEPVMLSFLNDKPYQKQLNCYITKTSNNAHQIVRDNIDHCPIYNGSIESNGPRYCPSFESVVLNFPERTSHRVFLEPEGWNTNTVYVNGMSMSLPLKLQEKIIHSIHGLEHAKIIQPAYNVEYCFVDPTQLYPTLQVKNIEGIFLAGQINGTTGYEEAAGQGLVAGANAGLFAGNKDMITLSRSQSYIGVMIDDITTKGIIEPYRLFTSRSEHRLHIRPDNAEMRLTGIGQSIGLISHERLEYALDKISKLSCIMHDLKNKFFTPHEICQAGHSISKDGIKRNGLDIANMMGLDAMCKMTNITLDHLDRNCMQYIQAEALYKNYLFRQDEEISFISELGNKVIPENIDLSSLSNEVRDMINIHKPKVLADLKRIPGMTPYAIVRINALIRF